MGKAAKALAPVVMAGAIVVAFGVTMLLTVWYGPGCQSSHKSISLGELSWWLAAPTTATRTSGTADEGHPRRFGC
jgi:hypothetical protein